MECREVKLEDCVSLVIDHRGLTPKKLSSDWSESGYRAISAKNIKTGNLVQQDSIKYVDDALYRRWMSEEVERGDIFITSEAPFGQVLYWDSDEKVVLSQRIFGLRPDNAICDSRYLYYWMSGRQFQGELNGRATGTTVIGLRQPELLNCAVRLPDLITQKVIGSILAVLDNKIKLNNQINDYLAVEY